MIPVEVVQEIQSLTSFGLRLARSRGLPEVDCEFVRDEVLMSLFRRYRQHGRLPDYSRPFVVTVVSNQLISYLRRRSIRGRQTNLDETDDTIPPANEMDPLARMIATETAEAIHEALVTLRHIYWDVLVRYYFADQSTAEIAAELKLSCATIQTRLVRARAQLADRLRSRNIG